MTEGCGAKIGPYDCCSIVVGDCLDVMAEIPNGWANMILTDPPYSFPMTQFRPGARSKIKSFGDFSPFQYFFKAVVKEARRILSHQGWAYIFCNEETRPVIYPILYDAFLRTKLLVWDKARIGLGGDWRRTYELIQMATDAPSKHSGDPDIIRCKAVSSSARLHYAEKPVSLARVLAAKHGVKTGFDPFVGSGALCEAMALEGIHFFGCDIKAEHVAIAEKRLSSTQLAMDNPGFTITVEDEEEK